MAKPDNQIDLVVVVSGVPRAATIKRHQKLQHLVQEVLGASGDHGRDVKDFELRTEAGVALDLELTAAAAGLVDGQTLFLSPHAGAGG